MDAIRIQDALTGIDYDHGESRGCPCQSADHNLVCGNGDQFDVVHLMNQPGAAGAATKNDAARSGAEGGGDAARRRHLNPLPTDLDKTIFGQLSFEVRPCEVFYPETIIGISIRRLRSIPICLCTNRSVAVQIIRRVQRSGLQGIEIERTVCRRVCRRIGASVTGWIAGDFIFVGGAL